jgi:pimeloyl-ACP methyl ester carboxylesterase
MKLHALTTLLAAVLLAAGCSRQAATPPPAPKPAASVAAQGPPPAPQAVPTESRVRSLAPDHSSIRYLVYGSGEPTLVLIHGWSCSAGYWDGQLNDLAVKHTVVTLDLAGHGRSDARKRKDWSMQNFGADVAAVVNAIGKPRVILVGHSMGGPVAIEAARQLPGKVIGIVGVDTLRDVATPYPKETTGPLLRAMHDDFAKATADLVDKNFFTDQSDPVVRKWIVKNMSSAPPKVAIPSFKSLLAMDYRAALGGLDLPIVAINAAQPPTDEAAIRKIVPRFRVVTMTGVGHFLMMEKPAQFNLMLARIADTWEMDEKKPAAPLSAPSPTR